MNYDTYAFAWKRWKLSQYYLENLHHQTNIHIRLEGLDGPRPSIELLEAADPDRYVQTARPLDVWLSSWQVKDVANAAGTILEAIGYVYQRRFGAPIYRYHDYDLDRGESAKDTTERERKAFVAMVLQLSNCLGEYGPIQIIPTTYRDHLYQWQHSMVSSTDEEAKERPEKMANAFWDDFGRRANLIVRDTLATEGWYPPSFKRALLFDRIKLYFLIDEMRTQHLRRGIRILTPMVDFWSDVRQGRTGWQDDWRLDPSQKEDSLGSKKYITIPESVPSAMWIEVFLAKFWWRGHYEPWVQERRFRRGLPNHQIQIEAHAFVALVMKEFNLSTPRHDQDILAWTESQRKYKDTGDRVQEAAEYFWFGLGKQFSGAFDAYM